jgi:hypothetical protein
MVFLPSALFDASVAETVLPATEAAARMMELSAKPAQIAAAGEALDHTPLDHPSRELLIRLIASDKTWRPVHTEWYKLSDNKADWDSLVALHANEGPKNLRDRLETRYGLTPGAAEAIEALVRAHGRSGMSLLASGGLCLIV